MSFPLEERIVAKTTGLKATGIIDLSLARQSLADGGHTRPKLGEWMVEIIKRSDTAASRSFPAMARRADPHPGPVVAGAPPVVAIADRISRHAPRLARYVDETLRVVPREEIV